MAGRKGRHRACEEGTLSVEHRGEGSLVELSVVLDSEADDYTTGVWREMLQRSYCAGALHGLRIK